MSYLLTHFPDSRTIMSSINASLYCLKEKCLFLSKMCAYVAAFFSNSTIHSRHKIYLVEFIRMLHIFSFVKHLLKMEDARP